MLMFLPANSFPFLCHLRFVYYTLLPGKIPETEIGDDTLRLISVTKHGGLLGTRQSERERENENTTRRFDP